MAMKTQTTVPEHICEMENILDRATQKMDELERNQELIHVLKRREE